MSIPMIKSIKIDQFDCNLEATENIASFIYKSMVGLIFIYVIAVRFMNPLVPFTGPDSIGYLGVAFNFLNTGQFTGIAERSFPYPAFLTILITMSKDVSVISLAQHVLGILGGVFYLRIMNLVRHYFLKLSLQEIFIYKLMTLVGLFLLLVSPWQLVMEHFTHPEALTMPLFMFYLYSALKLYGTIQKPECFLNSLKWSLVFFISNYLFFVFQPRFTIASLMGGVGFYCFQIIGDGRVVRKFALVAIPTLVLGLLINIPQIKKFSNKKAVNCNRNAGLFFYNLNTIAPIIRSDIDNPAFKEFDKGILKNVITDFQSAKLLENKDFSSGFFKTIGYNPDYTLKTYYSILTDFNGSFVKATGFYRYYLKRALFTNPFGLTNKVLTEMKYFYNESKIFIEEEGPYPWVSWENSYEVVKTWKAHFAKKPEVYDFYVNSLASVKNYKLNYKLPTSKIAENISAVVNKSYTFQCVIFIITLILSYIFKSRFLPFGIFVLFVMLFGFFVNLAISIGGTTMVQRYIYDQLSWNLFFILYSLFFIALVSKNDTKEIKSLLLKGRGVLP